MSDAKNLDVFTIREPSREGQKPFWVRIGRAYTNKDGSLSVYLDALPVNGKMQIREEQPKPQGGGREPF